MCQAETGLRVTGHVGITVLHTMVPVSHPVALVEQKRDLSGAGTLPILCIGTGALGSLAPGPWVLGLSQKPLVSRPVNTG